MKKLLFILAVSAILLSCGEPMQVTANPDKAAATSGTLGSEKASNSIPVRATDSLRTRDSLKKAP